MSSYEIMLSESQERMLIVVHKGREEEVKRIFDKWDLPWSEIGIITNTGHMVVRHGGKLIVDIPAKKIADESPVYHRDAQEPEYLKEVREFRLDGIPDSQSPISDLLKLLAWPSIASKNWVYRQYDHQVRDGSVVLPGSDAAVIRIKSDSLPIQGSARASRAAVDASSTAKTDDGASSATRGGACAPQRGFDVVIGNPPIIDALIKDGTVVGPRVDFGRAGLGVAVRAGAAKPDISSVEAFKQALLATKAVAYPGKGASGIYFVSLLDRMGIKDAMQSKLKPMEAEDTVEVVARGEADMVVVVSTRISDVPGVDRVGPIPAELQTNIGFAAGLSSSTKQPAAAKALIAFLSAPAAAATLKAKGVEPM